MLRADYFDGRSTRVRAVSISAAGDTLVIAGEDIDLRVALADVKIDERLGRAPRRLRLADGSFCEVRDLAELDLLLSSLAHVDGRVDRMQRRLPIVLLSCAAFLVLAFAAYQWVLPWAAARAARQLPPAIGRTLSVQTLKMLDGGVLLPSKVSKVRREELLARYHALRVPGGGTADSPLLFRSSTALGANAFTLPDSTIIVLDDLVTLVKDDRRMMAILAHELGHAHGHHGLQLLLQSSAVGVFLSFYIGDVSQLLAAAPAALLQAKYSQDLERQADDYGAALLLYNGLSPLLLADALSDLAQSHPGSVSGGYLASHPSTDERIRHLKQLAAQGGK
jgi:Zn-dependent protease with chaperone function